MKLYKNPPKYPRAKKKDVLETLHTEFWKKSLKNAYFLIFKCFLNLLKSKVLGVLEMAKTHMLHSVLTKFFFVKNENILDL